MWDRRGRIGKGAFGEVFLVYLRPQQALAGSGAAAWPQGAVAGKPYVLKRCVWARQRRPRGPRAWGGHLGGTRASAAPAHDPLLPRSIKLARQNEWQRQATHRELRLMAALQHPFVVVRPGRTRHACPRLSPLTPALTATRTRRPAARSPSSTRGWTTTTRSTWCWATASKATSAWCSPSARCGSGSVCKLPCRQPELPCCRWGRKHKPAGRRDLWVFTPEPSRLGARRPYPRSSTRVPHVCARAQGKLFEEHQLRSWLAQLLLALDYLERQCVLHVREAQRRQQRHTSRGRWRRSGGPEGSCAAGEKSTSRRCPPGCRAPSSPLSLCVGGRGGSQARSTPLPLRARAECACEGACLRACVRVLCARVLCASYRPRPRVKRATSGYSPRTLTWQRPCPWWSALLPSAAAWRWRPLGGACGVGSSALRQGRHRAPAGAGCTGMGTSSRLVLGGLWGSAWCRGAGDGQRNRSLPRRLRVRAVRAARHQDVQHLPARGRARAAGRLWAGQRAGRPGRALAARPVPGAQAGLSSPFQGATSAVHASAHVAQRLRASQHAAATGLLRPQPL